MKKGKWSKDEDSLIKNHIKKYGIGRSWQALSNTLGLERCGRSCRSRWLNYLRPGLKHGNFTPAEERIICEMYSKRGSCWTIIAAQLPGRTDLAIKNYWNSTLKKRFPVARGGTSARRRPPPAASTLSDTPTPDVELIVISEESMTTGSSSHGDMDKPVLAGSPSVQVQEQPPPPAAAGGNAAANEEPIAAAPISGPEMIEQKQEMGPLLLPMPSSDQTGGEMDITLAIMSPLPLSFMEPELASTIDFDDIDSFLTFFDD